MEKEILETQKEIAQLLVVLVRRDQTQATLIEEFGAAGFKPSRIAEILQTTANNVSVTLNRIKRSRK